MRCDSASGYIEENFEPSDRLAIVLLNKRTGLVTQRIAPAEKIASAEFQAWLRHRNAQKDEVYISMNALREDARGRTKADVQAIRHIYLDFDQDGDEAVSRLIRREDMPLPNYRVNTSPGKWQAVWRAGGFVPEQAEALQKWLARDTGADPAATDATRVLRLPGFYNHKYSEPHLVLVDHIVDRVYIPKDFPETSGQYHEPSRSNVRHTFPQGWHSQSELDWSYAKRALSRGEPIDSIVAAIANHRRNDKSDPEYYALHTVRKAALELAEEQRRSLSLPGDFDR